MIEQLRRTQGQEANENGNEDESKEETNEFLPKIDKEEQDLYERVFAKLYQIARKMPEDLTFYVIAALVKAGREEVIIAATNHYVFGTTISDVIYKHAEQALFEAVAHFNIPREKGEVKPELYVTLEPCSRRESGGMLPCTNIIKNAPIQLSKIIVSLIDWRNRRISGRGLQKLANERFNIVLLENTNDSQSKIEEINQELPPEKRIKIGLTLHIDEAEQLTLSALRKIDEQIGLYLELINDILNEIKSIADAEIFLRRLEEIKGDFKAVLEDNGFLRHVRGSAIDDTFNAEALYVQEQEKIWEEAKWSIQNKLKNIAKAAIGASIRRQRARAVASKIRQGQYSPIHVERREGKNGFV